MYVIEALRSVAPGIGEASLMELLGSVNWWAPRPLRRLYERIGLQETAPQAA
jgi:RND superfamily putative drug exporter